MPAAASCGTCGAKLRLRPHSCPLCGAKVDEEAHRERRSDVEEYQARLRQLRGDLRRLREEARGA